MRSQDRDIKKLKQFIKSFGLRLYFKPYTRYTDMAHYVADEYITVFVTKRTSKTEIILSLMHEIGHHLDYITNKRLDKDTEKAYSGFGAKEFRKYAGIILNIEKEGIRHMTSIHRILDLEIPISRVREQQKIDTFSYQFFYHNRKYPTSEQIKNFEKRIGYGKRKK